MILDQSLVTVSALFVVSYLVGSIPSTLIASRLAARVDLRDLGSGNAGGTNAIRVLGPVKGVAAGLADVSKGFICAALPTLWFGTAEGVAALSAGAGASAVVGHVWPLWAGFRGGKGVATCIGVLAWLDLPLAMAFCLLGMIAALLTKFVSVGSITASVALPLLLLVKAGVVDEAVPLSILLFCLLVPLLVVFTHRGNLKRLAAGTELRLGHRVDLSNAVPPMHAAKSNDNPDVNL